MAGEDEDVRSVLKQYGPALLVQCQYAQELSEELVSEWLERYMLAGQPDAKAKAQAISGQLADPRTFKSHGRFISAEDALNLGLTVDSLEKDQKLQDAVLSVFHAAMHTFNATTAVKIFENHLSKSFLKSTPLMIQQPAFMPMKLPPMLRPPTPPPVTPPAPPPPTQAAP